MDIQDIRDWLARKQAKLTSWLDLVMLSRAYEAEECLDHRILRFFELILAQTSTRPQLRLL